MSSRNLSAIGNEAFIAGVGYHKLRATVRRELAILIPSHFSDVKPDMDKAPNSGKVARVKASILGLMFQECEPVKAGLRSVLASSGCVSAFLPDAMGQYAQKVLEAKGKKDTGLSGLTTKDFWAKVADKCIPDVSGEDTTAVASRVDSIYAFASTFADIVDDLSQACNAGGWRERAVKGGAAGKGKGEAEAEGKDEAESIPSGDKDVTINDIIAMVKLFKGEAEELFVAFTMALEEAGWDLDAVLQADAGKIVRKTPAK
jgi:hypothetical protein